MVARLEQFANAISPEPMVDALIDTGTMTRARAEVAAPFRKFMGERILKHVIEPAGQIESYGSHVVVPRTTFNATTHPSETFHGSSYRFEMLDKHGAPLCANGARHWRRVADVHLPPATFAQEFSLDSFIGKLSVVRGEVILTRCDIGNSRYLLRDGFGGALPKGWQVNLCGRDRQLYCAG
ncbi:hypothetical protein [Sphingomonas sp. R86521]|uniref:hypothetical protein n=1 Tax=Sphingomonas sp. R86521 TaxID=3093860 RepID=UPI0036D23C47